MHTYSVYIISSSYQCIYSQHYFAHIFLCSDGVFGEEEKEGKVFTSNFPLNISQKGLIEFEVTFTAHLHTFYHLFILPSLTEETGAPFRI
jgi:hypothetical protein